VRTLRLLVEPAGDRLLVEVPTSRRERMRGLLGRDEPPPGHGLLLERTRSVHTFGMRRTIRVALLDHRLSVLAVRLVRPGRLVLPRRRVRHVLECSAATALRQGDLLRPSILRGDG
jgi:uncharacterized membrane protein (UPF0127 family)